MVDTLKSRVRFEIVGRVAVDQELAYPMFAINSEVSNGYLTALSVEIEHPEQWALEDIVEAARAELRLLCSLIGVGTTAEPGLGNALVSPTTAEGKSIGLGFANVHARVGIIRGLNAMPLESLLSKVKADPRLARQVDYLNSASIVADIVSKIRYGYMVLEQERERHRLFSTRRLSPCP
jgi:hypothetical protein